MKQNQLIYKTIKTYIQHINPYIKHIKTCIKPITAHIKHTKTYITLINKNLQTLI